MGGIEQVQVAIEVAARRDAGSIQVRRAKDEWPGPVRQPTRTTILMCLAGFKDARIAATRYMERVNARRCASDLAKNGPKRAAKNVGGRSRRELNRIDGFEMKAEAEELELHFPEYSGGCQGCWTA